MDINYCLLFHTTSTNEQMTVEDDDQMNVLTIHQEGRHRTPVRVTIDYEAETIRSMAASAAQRRHQGGPLHFINTFHDFKAVRTCCLLFKLQPP